MKSIELLIQPTGELRIDAAGFRGADCEKATAFLEEALGEITRKHKKPEYHVAVRRQQRQELGP